MKFLNFLEFWPDGSQAKNAKRSPKPEIQLEALDMATRETHTKRPREEDAALDNEEDVQDAKGAEHEHPCDIAMRVTNELKNRQKLGSDKERCDTLIKLVTEMKRDHDETKQILRDTQRDVATMQQIIDSKSKQAGRAGPALESLPPSYLQTSIE